MSKKLLYLVIVSRLCLPLIGYAQTACWLLKPIYQSITPFGESYYKVNTYSTMAIFDTNGNKIVEADSITYITNGYALALTNTNGKFRLKAIIDKSGNVKDISEEYYVDDYHFFSEDMLGVSNDKGKSGYINPDGKLEIPFIYVSVHPFREGLASVFKPKKGLKGLIRSVTNKKALVGSATYVNHKGAELNIRDGKNDPTFTASFKNGKGLVQMEDGSSFYVDPKGNRLEDGPNNKELGVDEYFAYSEENKKQEVNLPFIPSYNAAYSIYTEGPVKGYMANGVMMIPSQFQEAYGFASGFAIVKKDGKYGIIKQLGGTNSVKVSEKGGKISVQSVIPADWGNCPAKFLYITNGTDRLSFAMTGQESQRAVEGVVPVTNGEKIYELDVDGLIVWRQTNANAQATDETKSSGGISVSAPGKVTANSKGECVVNVRVTNRSGSAQSISISLSTGGNKSVKLAPGKTAVVSITTKIVKETRCVISAKSAAGNASGVTNLIPSFVL